MHNRKKIQIDMIAFRRDVELGTTVLVLAEKYGIAKSTVWRLKAEISGKIARRELGPMPDSDEPAEAFTLNIDVPSARLDDLLASMADSELRAAVSELSDQDKAYLFQIYLQRKLNEVVVVPEGQFALSTAE